MTSSTEYEHYGSMPSAIPCRKPTDIQGCDPVFGDEATPQMLTDNTDMFEIIGILFISTI